MSTARDTARRLRSHGFGAAIIGLRRAIEAANRVPLLRAVGCIVVRQLVRASFAALRGSPRVEGVFLRGSHGRGDAEPFSSDVDIAVTLREDSPDFTAACDLLGSLRAARRRNPLIRDAWQFIVGRAEWQLLVRNARLAGLDEWCDERGRRPELAAPPVAERLQRAAAWNRQHLWTTDAVRAVLSPGAPDAGDGLAFAAAEKKALTYAGRILGRAVPRRREHPPRTRSEWLDRATVLLERLDESARAVGAELDASPDGEPTVDAFREAPAAAEIRAALAAVDGGGAAFSRVLIHAGALVLVTREPPAPRATATLLAGLAPIADRLGRRCLLYSPATFALAPLHEEIWIVAPPVTPGVALPRLLREQLFYEALFHGAELRILADRAPPLQGFPLLTIKLARAIVFFRDGRLARGAEQAVALAVAGDREVEDRIGARPLDAPTWFDVNARLWIRLIALLEAESPAG